MTYIAAADLRESSQAEFAHGCVISSADVSTDALLDAIIARVSARIDDELNDHFEPEDNQTYDVDGDGTRRLYLPKRTRNIDSVSTRDADGTLTAETVVWRLRSSLNAAGTARVGDFDWLDIIPGRTLSTGAVWPEGPQTVRVIGDFSWVTSSVPSEIKRLTALITYDTAKTRGAHAGYAERISTQDTTYLMSIPGADAPTGIPEADEIIRRWRRAESVS